MCFLKFIIKTLLDFTGQVITGIGFMIFLGAIVAQLWIIVPVGIVLMLVGFFMMRS